MEPPIKDPMRGGHHTNNLSLRMTYSFPILLIHSNYVHISVVVYYSVHARTGTISYKVQSLKPLKVLTKVSIVNQPELIINL